MRGRAGSRGDERRSSRSRGALALVLGGALAACGGGTPVAPPPAFTVRLSVTGRAERGAALSIAAIDGTDTVPRARVRLTVAPADAASITDDGAVMLQRAGRITIRASLDDGRSATLDTAVATPPLIVLDLDVDGNRDVYRVALDGGDLERLTSSPNDDSSPSAAAGTIVFVSTRHGLGELYAVSASGGGERRLTTTREHEEAPTLSADGRRLAFVRPAGGVTRVWVADAAAVGAVRLTADTPQNAGAPEASPAWGPGARIAFTSTERAQADVALTTVETLPATISVLAASSPSADVEPAWDSAGSRLAFVSTRDGAPSLYVAGAQGGAATRLTPAGINASQPAWTPDGRIVFVARRGGTAGLMWLDPASPGALHEIPLPGREPAHPSAVR